MPLSTSGWIFRFVDFASLCSRAQVFSDFHRDLIQVSIDIDVRKSEHLKAFRLQKLRPRRIVVLLLIVESPVQFDDQSPFEADKVDDIRADWMLPAEFATLELPIPEQLPKSSFRFREVSA